MRRKNREETNETNIPPYKNVKELTELQVLIFFSVITRLTRVMLPKLFYTDCNPNIWASFIGPNKCEILTGIRISKNKIRPRFKKKFCPQGKQYLFSLPPYKGREYTEGHFDSNLRRTKARRGVGEIQGGPRP
jgi:hypothetical protein